MICIAARVRAHLFFLGCQRRPGSTVLFLPSPDSSDLSIRALMANEQARPDPRLAIQACAWPVASCRAGYGNAVHCLYLLNRCSCDINRILEAAFIRITTRVSKVTRSFRSLYSSQNTQARLCVGEEALHAFLWSAPQSCLQSWKPRTRPIFAGLRQSLVARCRNDVVVMLKWAKRYIVRPRIFVQQLAEAT